MTRNIVLVDDHKIVRQGLKLLLETESDMHVIAEAGNGSEAAKIVAQVRPDILVTDIRMPGISGIELTKAVKNTSPETIVIVLSMFGEEIYVLEALKSGANGFVIKESSGDELISAIKHCDEGHFFVSESILTNRIKEMMRETSKEA